MTTFSFRFLLCSAMVAFLVGCGGSGTSKSGGGGGGVSNPTTVTYTFGTAPLVVAAQIGTGAYTIQTLVSNKLTLTLPTGVTDFAVAYQCPAINVTDTPQNYAYIQEANVADGTAFYGLCVDFGGSEGLATVKIDPSAFPAANSGALDGEAFLWSPGILNVQEQLPVGTYDIPVTLSTVANGDFQGTLLAAKVLRSQTVPGALNGGATVTFSPSDAPTKQAATLGNVPDGLTVAGVYAYFDLATGSYIGMTLQDSPNQFLVMPAGVQESGDYYEVGAVAYAPSGGQQVQVSNYTTSSGPQSLSFPAAWSYAGPTPSRSPTFDFTYSGFAGSPHFADYASLGWFQVGGPGGSTYSINMTATANYQGQSTLMTIPDFSTLTGFFAPTSGVSVQWEADIDQTPSSVTVPPSGTEQIVSTSGGYVEP